MVTEHLTFRCCLTRLTCASPQVRSELQSCVSRQQEALRCREVWLLGQIELLEQVKTETLQQQLHQLHRVTGGWGLFTCVECLFTYLLTCAVSVLQLRGQFDVIAYQLQNSGSNDLNNQLTSCMEKYVRTHTNTCTHTALWARSHLSGLFSLLVLSPVGVAVPVCTPSVKACSQDFTV